MTIDDLTLKYKEFVTKMNRKGIPLPLLTDPKSGRGSVSYTMMWISFNLCVVGVIGKWSKALDGIDINQAQSLFYACAALYWGRGFQNGKNGSIIASKDFSGDNEEGHDHGKSNVDVKVNVNASAKEKIE
jgi:hypothetical protein